eukprot:jgi/Botrbrau1/15923/Bobra.40_1s0103.1
MGSGQKAFSRTWQGGSLHPEGPGLRVELRPTEGQETAAERAACLIRREPLDKCVTTMEAISRALSLMEHDNGMVQQTLLGPLRRLTSLQANFDPAVRARISGKQWRGRSQTKPT